MSNINKEKLYSLFFSKEIKKEDEKYLPIVFAAVDNEDDEGFYPLNIFSKNIKKINKNYLHYFLKSKKFLRSNSYSFIYSIVYGEIALRAKSKYLQLLILNNLYMNIKINVAKRINKKYLSKIIACGYYNDDELLPIIARRSDLDMLKTMMHNKCEECYSSLIQKNIFLIIYEKTCEEYDIKIKKLEAELSSLKLK